MSHRIIHVDGSGWNGTDSAYCIYSEKKIPGYKKIILKVLNEKKTVIQIEYAAILEALRICKEKNLKNVNICSDSEQAVNEINSFKEHDKNKLLFEEASKLIDCLEKVNLIWIPRDENKAGRYLEKRLTALHSYKKISTKGRIGPKKKKSTVLHASRRKIKKHRKKLLKKGKSKRKKK